MEKKRKITGTDVAVILVVSLLGGVLRYWLRNDISGDYRSFLLPWYETMRESGAAALTSQIGDYNLPYQTWIYGMTKLPLPPLYAYKMVSCIFDYLLAALIGLWVGKDTHRAQAGVAAYGFALLFPQLWIDSAHWAQCDAIYSFWVVLAVFLYTREKWELSFFSLGIALSFKLQAVFVLPFFGIAWLLRHTHSLRKFLWIIPGFYLFCLPAILFGGRSWLDPFLVYLNQTTEYSAIRFNFPSFWGILFPAGTHAEWNKAAILLTLAIFLFGTWKLSDQKSHMQWDVMHVVIWSIWTCVLFLPNMHERYAYTLDVLMLVFLFVRSTAKDAPVILICWLCSLVCYGTARLELPYSPDLFRITCCLYLAAYCRFCRTRLYSIAQATSHT